MLVLFFFLLGVGGGGGDNFVRFHLICVFLNKEQYS